MLYTWYFLAVLILGGEINEVIMPISVSETKCEVARLEFKEQIPMMEDRVGMNMGVEAEIELTSECYLLEVPNEGGVEV